MRIAVIGAGVIGVTSAVAIKEAFPRAEVTIFSDKFTPNTTGDGSAGLWLPYLLSNTDPEKINRWSILTYKWMESFWKSELAGEVGVCLLPIYRVSSEPKSDLISSWGTKVHGMYRMSEGDLKRLSKIKKMNYSCGNHFVTYTFEPQKFLPFLMKKFKLMNGKIIKRKMLDLKELGREGYDVVINCTGLGSADLIGDHLVTPIRGRISKVKGPWLFEAFIEDHCGGNYVIPNTDSVILGGTHQEIYDTSVNQQDSKFIMEGCKRLYPSINKCQDMKEWVGLRPGRTEVRLEPEFIPISKQKGLLVIHNYGHGGSGVTLSWGCALDVVDILGQQKKVKFLAKL